MATLVRWEPFRELASLQSEMSRMLNGLAEGPGRTGATEWAPALDVWETEAELVYAFDLPGVPEDAIQIEVADDTLTLSAERTREEEKSTDRFYRFERRFGSFSRAVGLPQGVGRVEDRGRLQGRRRRDPRPQARRAEAAPDPDRVGAGRPRGVADELASPRRLGARARRQACEPGVGRSR